MKPRLITATYYRALLRALIETGYANLGADERADIDGLNSGRVRVAATSNK